MRVPTVAACRRWPHFAAMRYRDAPHLDMGSFYAREPRFGRMYRILGYLGVIIAGYFHNDPDILARLLIALLVVWLMAWYRVVGSLWRSSTVAAILLCAFLLTQAKVAAMTRDHAAPSTVSTSTVSTSTVSTSTVSPSTVSTANAVEIGVHP